MEDADRCGVICFEALKQISEAHGFLPDFPSAEIASYVLGRYLVNPRVYSVVAELDGRIAGSAFAWEEPQVAGVGPVTVSPEALPLKRSSERGEKADENQSIKLTTFPCVSITPFGMPVEPEVYRIKTRSEGFTSALTPTPLDAVAASKGVDISFAA